MDIRRPTPLLGGLSPQAFMRRHWQKRPLLIRQAVPGIVPPLDRGALFALAARDDVESRLVVRDGRRWTLRHGPLPRRALPPLARARWTLLVQGLDTHVAAAHELLARFRFVPDARLDDLMISYASDGGGVGPHLDSYDVFLLQVHGRRRWRIGRVADPGLVPGLPLAILARFRAEEEWVLDPGDMLYLPPLWGHDGIAVGECMTCSIGFRAETAEGLADAVLQRLVDTPPQRSDAARYRDPAQAAVVHPARVPPALAAFAARAVARRLGEPRAIAHAVGEVLSEPKPDLTFAGRGRAGRGGDLRLDRATRMLYDATSIYINGERYVAGGRDATILRRLADRRALDAAALDGLSTEARAIVDEWIGAGWVHQADTPRKRR
jgi:50S ribosomal protein L16 3-hydroxylase